MSSQVRRQTKDPNNGSSSMFAKVEQEIAEGYLEVEITGMSLRRLAVTYTVLVRSAWLHAVGSVRSLLRPTPAL